MVELTPDYKMPQTWLLLIFGEQRQYAGNLGYTDEISKLYKYDSFVPNYRRISEGDIAVLRGIHKLFGVAIIERIDFCEGTKERLRCPVCMTAKLKKRKVMNPKFRCYTGGHEFDVPIKQVVECRLFTAHFGDSFVLAEAAVSIEALRKACPKYNDQLAIQLLDFGRIKATLIVQVPAVRQLLVTQNNSDYLEPDEAEPVEIPESQSETLYLPISGDSRQIVMRQIRKRRGQQKFRQALRSRYGDQCMITGCQLMDIVEAAHISPYRGDADNHPENGLLLRTDLHTLFDLDLLGIHPESLQVHFHPASRCAGYDLWEGKTLLSSNIKPSQAALESRWRLFIMRLKNENY